MKKLILFTLLLFSAACSTIPQKEIITQTKVEKLTLDDALFTPCVPDKPMDQQSYLALSIPEREQYLTQYILSLYQVIKICNNQLEAIHTLSKQQNTTSPK
jgi:hypothetical protein